MLWGVRWAIERLRKLRSDLLPGNVNPIDAVERTRSPKKHTRHPLAADAAKRFLAACHGSSIVAKRDHAAVLLGFATGLRRAGLASIDLDRVAGFGDHVRMTVTLKGGEVYGVPVSGHLWQMIEPYREMLGDRGPLFRSIRPPGPSASTFVVGTRPISPQGLYQILQRRALTARIPNFHPHLLRHTLVSWCLDAGIDPLLISVVTGHAVSAAGASARSLEHYTDRSMPSLGSKAAAAVWNLLVEKLEL
jgi:integrase